MNTATFADVLAAGPVLARRGLICPLCTGRIRTGATAYAVGRRSVHPGCFMQEAASKTPNTSISFACSVESRRRQKREEVSRCLPKGVMNRWRMGLIRAVKLLRQWRGLRMPAEAEKVAWRFYWERALEMEAIRVLFCGEDPTER